MSISGGNLEDSFLTVAEVAEMLKLNQQTVRNWIDQGSLPALRVGRRVRITRSDPDQVLTDAYSGRASSGAAGASPPSAEYFWRGAPVVSAEPPYELRPGTGRRGPAELWERFDSAVQTLNRAITGSDAASVADAFGEISEAAAALAESVAREDAAGATSKSRGAA